MSSNILIHKLTDDCKDVKFVEIDETIGDKFTVIEFLQMCLDETIIDYDGHGAFVFTIGGKEYTAIDEFSFSIDDDVVYYNKEALTSILVFCRNFGIKHIMWYNK